MSSPDIDRIDRVIILPNPTKKGEEFTVKGTGVEQERSNAIPPHYKQM